MHKVVFVVSFTGMSRNAPLFWLPVFISYHLQNARNAVSDNQIFKIFMGEQTSGSHLVRLLVGTHPPAKKKPAHESAIVF